MCCDEKKKYQTPVVRQLTREQINEKIKIALEARERKYAQLGLVDTWDKPKES